MTRRRDVLRSIASSILTASFAGGLTCPACSPRSVDGRVTAALWFAYGGKNREVLLSLVDQWNHSQDRFHLHATYQGDYFEALAKLRTAIAAKAAPAVTHVIGEIVPYLAEAGVLEPLASFAPSLRDAADPFDLVPQLAQAKGFAGGASRPLVALPFNRSTPIAYFNKSLFREMGRAPPTTWAELREVAARATRPGRWGFGCPIDWWFWLALVGQAGGELVGPDGTPSLGGEAGVRALELWQAMVRDDRSMRPPPGRDYNAWQVVNSDFVSGRVAMIWTSTAFLRYLEENARFEVGAAPLPRDQRFSVPTGGTFFVMPKGPPRAEQEAAFAFLAWMMQPSQANAWATRTGYIPVSRPGIAALEAAGFYAAHPNDRVALDQLSVAEPWPWSTELFRIEREAVQPRLEEAVLAGRDAREVLGEARRVALEP